MTHSSGYITGNIPGPLKRHTVQTTEAGRQVGTKRIASAGVGRGCSGVTQVGEGSPCDEGGNGGGVHSVGDVAGSGVGR